MASNAATATLSSGRRLGWLETALLVLAALACALGAAAWMTEADQATAALPTNSNIDAFRDRFLGASPSDFHLRSIGHQSFDRFALAARERKVRDARDLLAQQLSAPDWRTAALDGATGTGNDTKPATSSDIPLPRSRPVAANMEASVATAQVDLGVRQDNRSMLQKFTDLLPGRITLASLAPDSEVFRKGPDLSALGYDSQTAVYDITAKAVYLPSGASLEAHSGMGSLKDDPDHVSKPNIGATPPAIYELKPREQLFHGVRALRMTPVEGTSALGRVGLLTHSYMLGPNGDSNGCVSIRNYERFIKAFDDGEINRLVVVPSLSGTISASQRATSPS